MMTTFDVGILVENGNLLQAKANDLTVFDSGKQSLVTFFFQGIYLRNVTE